jgi:ATP-dependent protease ClpP protease subunit
MISGDLFEATCRGLTAGGPRTLSVAATDRIRLASGVRQIKRITASGMAIRYRRRSHWIALFGLAATLLCVPPEPLQAQQEPNPFDQFDVSWTNHCPVVDDARLCDFTIRIQGQIIAGTGARFEIALARLQQREPLIVELNSQGGDVATALKMGRMIRSSRGHTVINGDATCASSCVLLFGAGVSRFVVDGGKLGIHRPALTAVPAQSDMDTVKAAADQGARELRAYAAEMNINERLIDDMLVVPPQDVRWLSSEDRQGYGLGFLDPVYEETAVIEGAKTYNIRPSEYRRRDGWQNLRVGIARHQTGRGLFLNVTGFSKQSAANVR